MRINQQLAPGLGEVLPGTVILPYNPLHPLAGYRRPHMAELLPAKFTLPENPLLRALSYGMGCSQCSRGVGVLDMASPGMGGLGQFSLDSITSSLSSVPMTTWLMIGGGAVLLYLIMGRESGYSEARAQALERVRAQHPRGYQRVRRAIAAY